MRERGADKPAGPIEAGKNEAGLLDVEFAYRPLPEGHIRVMDLYPGKGDDPVVLSLSTERLGAAPYTAVSYCWGSIDRPHKVLCGHSTVDSGSAGLTVTPAARPSGFVRITSSLLELLQAIRKETTYLRLWVDSVCINQADLAEKAVQVAGMDLLYDNAHGTLAYVGAWGRDADAAWRCAATLAHMSDWETETVQQAIGSVEDVGIPVDDAGTERSFREMWFDFTEFLGREWFGRIWIVQEAVLSRHIGIVCGARSLSWDVLVEACEAVENHRIRERDHRVARCRNVLNIERRRQGYVEVRRQVKETGRVDMARMSEFYIDMHLASMQMWTRGCGATDPRDKVFALINISLGERDRWPAIDYTVSVADLYCRVAEVWFRTQPSRPLQFLTCVTGSADAPDLPSWVPDWRENWRSDSLARAKTKGKGACGGLKCIATLPDLAAPVRLPAHLVVRGAVLFSVAQTEPLKLPEGQWRNARHARLMERFPDPYPTTKESYVEAFGKAANPQCPRDFEDIPDRTGTFWEHMDNPQRHRTAGASGSGSSSQQLRGVARSQSELYDRLPESYRAAAHAAQESNIEGRTWFISAEGFMGLVPAHTRPGDEICLFGGGTTLYAVRHLRSEDDEDVYRFLGECFVYGLMDGEAARGMPREAVQDFILE